MSLGVGALREATLSTHQPVPADSELAVVVRADTEGGEPSQTLAEMVEAQVLDVPARGRRPTWSAPIDDLGDGTFRAVLSPSMDETNRRQFRGCLEDFRLDHFRMDVLALDDVGGDGLDDVEPPRRRPTARRGRLPGVVGRRAQRAAPASPTAPPPR